MAGLRVWVSSLAVIFLAGAAVLACDDCLLTWGGIPYVAQTYVRPTAIAYGPCPCIPEPQIRLAHPTPAPATPGPGVLGSHEPPLAAKPAAKQGPKIIQNRTFSSVPQVTEPPSELCRVTFWNLSGFDVRLSIGDRANEIGKDKALTLNLQRHFTWQINNLHASKAEAVADDVNHFDVLIK